MVLKIHVVHRGGHAYYTEGLVPGRAEGGRVAGESPGIWSGAGTSALGMAGMVEAEPFHEVCEGRDPIGGGNLRAARGVRSVCAYDLTFCAPKSVSVLHLLAPRELAGAVGDGHRAAVADAADYLQRAGLAVRRSHGGQVARLATTGAVAGAFVHRTSRTLDPHLHTHLVVANVAQGVDGRWSAVDGRRIFAHASAVQSIYHARLRSELTERLGAAWEVRPSGLGDVVGVDPVLRHIFSQRSADLDEYQAGRGRTGNGSARSRGAFHATRPDKDRAASVDSLVAAWRERAGEFGFDLGDLTRVVGLAHTRPSGAVIDGDRVCRRLKQLGQRQQSFAHRDLVAVIAGASPAGTRAAVVESLATHLVDVAGAPVDRGEPGGRPVVDGGGKTGTAARSVASDPRWEAAQVVRAAGRHAEDLVVATGPGGLPVPDSPTLDFDRLERGRETRPARSPALLRSPAPDLGR